MSAIMGISLTTFQRLEGGQSGVRVTGHIICKLCDHFHMAADAAVLIDLEAMNADPADFPTLE